MGEYSPGRKCFKAIMAGCLGLAVFQDGIAQPGSDTVIAYSCDVFTETAQQVDCLRRLSGQNEGSENPAERVGQGSEGSESEALQKRRQVFETFYSNVRDVNSGVLNYTNKSEWPMNMSTMLRERQAEQERIGD